MSETEVDETENFKDIVDRSLRKWLEIRLDLRDIIERMSQYCAFCDEYHCEDDEEAPDDCKCPAKKSCDYAMNTIYPDTKLLRKNISILIAKLRRMKP